MTRVIDNLLLYLRRFFGNVGIEECDWECSGSVIDGCCWMSISVAVNIGVGIIVVAVAAEELDVAAMVAVNV